MIRRRPSVTEDPWARERRHDDLFLPCVIVIDLRDDDFIDFFVS